MKRLSLILLLGLAACGTTRPDLEVMAESPASVTVWGKSVYCFTCTEPQDVVSDQQIIDLAAERCGRYGKTPRRLYERRTVSGRAITFDCVQQ